MVKSFPQLFRILPSINQKGVALITQRVVHVGKDVKVDAVLAMQGGV